MVGGLHEEVQVNETPIAIRMRSSFRNMVEVIGKLFLR